MKPEIELFGLVITERKAQYLIGRKKDSTWYVFDQGIKPKKVNALATSLDDKKEISDKNQQQKIDNLLDFKNKYVEGGLNLGKVTDALYFTALPGKPA